MGPILYSIGLAVYYNIVRLFALFNTRASTFINSRNVSPIFNKNIIDSHPKLWIHCASHGEYETAKPIINRYKSSYQIHLTFYSPSGYEVAVLEPQYWDSIRYLTFDRRKAMQKLLAEIDPYLVIFIQYEYWYHLLSILAEKQVPYIYYGIQLSSNHILTKWYARFLTRLVSRSKLILVRDHQSLDIAKGLLQTKILNVGDVRWLQADVNRKTPYNASIFDPTNTWIVLGSIWEEDLKLWKPIIQEHRDLNFCIAPHDISEEYIKQLENILNLNTCRYSVSNEHSACRIIIVDTLGDLKYIYRCASLVYIGGGLGDGLHNCIEAAVYSKKLIISGDGASNPEANALMQNQFATAITNTDEIRKAMSNYLQSEADERYESYIASEIATSQMAFSLLDHELNV